MEWKQVKSVCGIRIHRQRAARVPLWQGGTPMHYPLLRSYDASCVSTRLVFAVKKSSCELFSFGMTQTYYGQDIWLLNFASKHTFHCLFQSNPYLHTFMLLNTSGLLKKYSIFFYSPLLTFLTHMTFIFAGKNVPASSSVTSKLPKE